MNTTPSTWKLAASCAAAVFGGYGLGLLLPTIVRTVL